MKENNTTPLSKVKFDNNGMLVNDYITFENSTKHKCDKCGKCESVIPALNKQLCKKCYNDLINYII